MSNPDKNVVVLQNNNTAFAGLISRAKTEFELFSICNRLGDVFGLPFFSVVRLPTDLEENLSSITLLSNWPNSLVSEFDRNRLLKNSEIFAHLKTSTEPYFLPIGSSDLSNLGDQEFLTSSIFQAHHIKEGVFFSVHLADGQVGSVSFCGEIINLLDDEIKELNYLSGLIFSSFHSLRNKNLSNDFNLTKREIDCLYWISRGKNNNEISSIFELSERTIHHYLESAIRKLDTNNQAHAASKALRLKIIE